MKSWHDRLFEIRQRVLSLGRRFDARPQRERMAMVLAVVAVLVLAGDRFWLTPAFRHFKESSQSLADARGAQQALMDESEKRRVQGDAERRALGAEIAQWKERTAAGAQGLAATQAGLIGPDRMAALLEQMLPRQGGVRIVGLKTLPPQDAHAPLPPAAPAPAAALPAAAASAVPALGAGLTARIPAAPPPPLPSASLYRHGVEITVEGSYGDLMNYLSTLESLPGPRLLWGGVAMKVERHPTVRLSFTVYTLSVNRAWLEL
jgi:MSHA biogenesis protein MshJ